MLYRIQSTALVQSGNTLEILPNATAGTDNRALLITDNADTALFGVEWGGYFDPVRIFETSGSGVIRVLDTDLPYDTTRWAGVTADWQ